MLNFICALGNTVERALYIFTQNRQPALSFGTEISKVEINECIPHREVSIWLGRVIAGDRQKQMTFASWFWQHLQWRCHPCEIFWRGIQLVCGKDLALLLLLVQNWLSRDSVFLLPPFTLFSDSSPGTVAWLLFPLSSAAPCSTRCCISLQ